MRGSIDIGSNSILLLVCDEQMNIVANESRVTGLGRDLDLNKQFLDEAMADSEAVFEEYFEICKKLGLDTSKVIVTATEASRVAKNAPAFFESIKNKYGFEVTVITGEAEAYFSTMGVLMDNSIQEDQITIMDIGGASTELIRVDVSNKSILNSFSMPIGVIRLNNWKAGNRLQDEMDLVFQQYAQQIDAVADSKIYCVAGTMTSVGNIALKNRDFKESEVNGLELKFNTLEALQGAYEKCTPAEMLSEFPFLGKRSKSIHSGFILARNVLEKLKCDTIYISTYGLRYGTLMSGEINDGFIYKA